MSAATTAWPLIVTARHMLENLGVGMYKDLADCLWEPVRNGVVACMPGDNWVPGVGDIDIQLVQNHPLGGKDWTLIILDRGHGFRTQDIRQYSALGSLDDNEGAYSGAAQKRIGRFACLALNRKCLENKDITTGFHVLTRTAQDGPVTYFSMIPELLQKKGLDPQQKNPNCAELGPYRGIKGSFTAIVIPHSVFTNYDDIRKALAYRVPRKPQQMFKLLVGGKPLAPPNLASGFMTANPAAGIEVYVDRIPEKSQEAGGIWFTDAHTGIRVANARDLANHLTWPLYHYNLVGDIFVPDLLMHQDTARGSLTHRFLNSEKWKKVWGYLALQVAGPLEALLGEEERVAKDSMGQMMLDITDAFNSAFGPPDQNVVGIGVRVETPKDGGGDSKKGESGRSGKKSTHSGGGGTSGGTTSDTRFRPVPFRIGDDTFLLGRRSMDGRVLAEVDPRNGRVLYLNDTYQFMPPSRQARRQHVVDMVLLAVGRFRFPDSAYAATIYSGEMFGRVRTKLNQTTKSRRTSK